MARQVKYTSLDRVLAKLYRDLGLEEINESDVIEWSGEALEFIGAQISYDQAVAFIEIENHQADLPNNLHQIIQVARNNRWSKENKEALCPGNIKLDCTTEEIINSEESGLPCGCGDSEGNLSLLDAVPLDCNGNFIEEGEVAYYRPYFDLKYEYELWGNSHYYKQHYTPVRLSNHNFIGSLVCDLGEESIYQSCKDEYTIVQNKIRTSFKEGSIAIAYFKQAIDEETGFPLVPDDASVLSAITYYVTWKYMQRMWYMGREGYSDKMQQAEQQWIWYCKQAGNRFFLPHTDDDFQNLTDIRNQLLPSKDKYYGFFGKLGRPGDNTFKLR